MRVLEWIVNRCRGSGRSHETQLGWMPRYDEINMMGLDGMTQERFDEIMRVDHKELRQELLNAEELYLDLYDYLPKELVYQRELLAGRF
jgi:phosphoenolpyruvate carboxykinase (GTP)